MRKKLKNTLKIEHIRNGKVVATYTEDIVTEYSDEGRAYIMHFPEEITCRADDVVRVTGDVELDVGVVLRLEE